MPNTININDDIRTLAQWNATSSRNAYSNVRPKNWRVPHIPGTLHRTIKYATKRLPCVPHSSPGQYSQGRKYNNCQNLNLSLRRTRIWNKINIGNRSNYKNKKVPTNYCSSILPTETQSEERILYCNGLEKFIVGGDFSAKHTHWGSKLVATRGTELLKAVIDIPLENQHTNRTPDLLDFFISRKIPTNMPRRGMIRIHNTNHSRWQIILKRNKPCTSK